MDYARLYTYVFKRFSVLSARRTLLPTAWYTLTKPALPPSDKPGLFTMNILPPLARVWHHIARKSLGDAVDITMFDCSGTLKQKDFPGVRIQKFLNPRHAVKCDQFIINIARNRDIAWVCDDDVFILDRGALDVVQRELAVPNTASLSFIPRTWWTMRIHGKEYQPSGTYCIAFKREIFVKEHCSFMRADGNPHLNRMGEPMRRYDSFDKANEQLLEKGYRCAIVPEQERKKYVSGFTGTSGAVMLLWYFRTPEQTLDYLLSPPRKSWEGNMLPSVLAGLFTVTAVQECYTRIVGRPYPLPALPARETLEKIRRDVEPLFRGDMSIDWVDETSERIKAAL